MRVLYIGHYSEGSTSKMRGECLKALLRPDEFLVVNTDIPMQKTQRVFRSLGWRYKIGPFISNINAFIRQSIGTQAYFDLAWIDKGVFIQPELVEEIRNRSTKLVHFTPDPAFTYHQSRLFYQAIPYYDHCITTKSFEIADYKVYQARSVIFCTQGYDPKIHRPFHGYAEKRGVVFVGHREDDREEAISALLERNIPVKLAGINWGKLVSRYKNNPNLEYHGTGVFGEAYAQLLSGSLLGLGFLSKIVPEKHTTRTFEIPACGTALVTERNEEIAAIYQDDEVIFFDNLDDMVQKTVFAYFHPENLKTITEMGYMKVLQGPYSYESILQQIIAQIELPNFKINQ
jgi:hypothetical protein